MRPASGEIGVWDPLARVFHWTLAASFLGAFLSEDTRTLHETLGWIAFAAVGVRLVRGFLGPRHARFADFVPFAAAFALAPARAPRVGTASGSAAGTAAISTGRSAT